MENRRRILVVGGTGYLGQHLLQYLLTTSSSLDIAFTHHRPIPPQELLDALPCVKSFQVDVRTGEGFSAVSASFGQPDIVVNCAAMSVPRACEMDPDTAMATNQPSSLVKWLLDSRNDNSLLIHLSTDQVYEGVKSFYKEEDETIPVNIYGKSKVAAEKLISETFQNYVILRSSIIYGPQTLSPVARSLPIQWMDNVLSQGKEVDFFYDEYRCPIYVKDMVHTISSLTNTWISDRKKMQLVINAGGPDRVSRVEMAKSVALHRGYSFSLIKSVSASSVNRGVLSPADISMDITRLVEFLGTNPTSFHDGVKATLETIPSS
ncbi:dTDP-4-dehydrorhamnose reductase [Rhynchospora pubera]|uniref:dTDP-4-dehydrorhamnose reductase n=1 Tax=Rhynchospora pubera TaxID=906938 RepID=A0AAV8EVS6_9POAL|nr:dTDP-4-dehydrorhamnose reductase [Rhynchospora pubera]KAJ4785287.1 dTDP-4-dehydrorhamnose reductase [Rhynchospora pubera]